MKIIFIVALFTPSVLFAQYDPKKGYVGDWFYIDQGLTPPSFPVTKTVDYRSIMPTYIKQEEPATKLSDYDNSTIFNLAAKVIKQSNILETPDAQAIMNTAIVIKCYQSVFPKEPLSIITPISNYNIYLTLLDRIHGYLLTTDTKKESLTNIFDILFDEKNNIFNNALDAIEHDPNNSENLKRLIMLNNLISLFKQNGGKSAYLNASSETYKRFKADLDIARNNSGAKAMLKHLETAINNKVNIQDLIKENPQVYSYENIKDLITLAEAEKDISIALDYLVKARSLAIETGNSSLLELITKARMRITNNPLKALVRRILNTWDVQFDDPNEAISFALEEIINNLQGNLSNPWVKDIVIGTFELNYKDSLYQQCENKKLTNVLFLKTLATNEKIYINGEMVDIVDFYTSYTDSYNIKDLLEGYTVISQANLNKITLNVKDLNLDKTQIIKNLNKLNTEYSLMKK